MTAGIDPPLDDDDEDHEDVIQAGLAALRAANERAKQSEFYVVVVNNQVIRKTKSGTVEVIANLPHRVKVDIRSKRASS